MKRRYVVLLGILISGSVFASESQLSNPLLLGSEKAESSAQVMSLMDWSEASGYSHFAWGRGQNGWGYCYEWDYYGNVLNGGYPVASYNCEAVQPSRFDWGRGQNGWGYCYQWTPQGFAMNEGQAVANYSCESVHPSRYAWGRGQNGLTYCYQWTPYGVAMNEGRPVPEYYCRY